MLDSLVVPIVRVVLEQPHRHMEIKGIIRFILVAVVGFRSKRNKRL